MNDNDILPEEPYNLHETWLTRPVNEMESNGEPSSSFKINGYSWKLIVFPKGYNTKEYLSVILLMTSKISNSHNVKFSIKTIGGKKIAEESAEFTFSRHVTNRGFFDFIPLSELSQYTTPENQLNLDLKIDFTPKTSIAGSSFRKMTGFVGLKPCGKTYYFNSFIQILFHLNSFCLEVLKQRNQQNLPEFEAIKNIFTLLYYSPIAPSTSEITQIINMQSEDDWYQKDFQSFLFKFFHNCQKLIQNMFSIEVNEYKGKYARKNLYFAIQIGNLRSNFGSLQNFLENYSNTEGPEDVKCVKFTSLPPILIFSINCFEDSPPHAKIKGRFSYPYELDMTPYMEDRSVSTKYELFGVVRHQGEKFDGHFSSFCRTSESSDWLKFDDKFVSHSNKQSALDDNFGSTMQNVSVILLSYVRKKKISEVMRKIEYADLPDSANAYYKRWYEQHHENVPSVDLSLFTLKDYADAILPNATVDAKISSSFKIEKLPDNLTYKDILYEIQRCVGMKSVSLWQLDDAMYPTKLLPLSTSVKEIKKVFVSPKQTGNFPFFVAFFDPNKSDKTNILSIVSFEAFNPASSPAIALHRLRSTLGISLDVKMVCFLYSSGRAKRISLTQPIGNEKHGIIVFQKQTSEFADLRPRSIDLLPDLDGQSSFPQYLDFINNAGTITAASVDDFDKSIQFEISMKAPLRELASCIRILINLPQDSSILLYRKENNKPSHKPLNLGGQGIISQFIVGNFVFFQVIPGISQEQIQNLALFQCLVIGPRLEFIEKAIFLMNPFFRVNDVIGKFVENNRFENQKFRFVQLNRSRIICTLNDKSSIPSSDDLNYRIEFAPQSQFNVPVEKLLRVAFSKDEKIPSSSIFGFPFYLKVNVDEPFLNTLSRINRSIDLKLNLNFVDYKYVYSNDILSINFLELNENAILSNLCTGKSIMLYIIPANPSFINDYQNDINNRKPKIYI